MNKDKNAIIISDNPLSEEQQQTLASLLDVLIPPSDDGAMPSAAELDIIAYVRERVPELVPAIIQGLNTLDEQCANRNKEKFALLARPDRQSLVEELSATQPDMFNALLTHTLSCYYQDDRVRKGLGLEPGPPFPRGNTIEPGDLSLLEPVRQRPKLYRDVSA